MAKNGFKRFKILIKFTVIFFLTSLCTCKEFELELLLSIKASINDPFQALSSWNSSVFFCKWEGVSCLDSSHVSKIELPEKNLSGRISYSIFRLPDIQTIDLSNNQFIGEIPPTLSSCFSLRYLNLSNNNLTGVIQAGPLPVLETLDLSNNMLSGKIPQDMGLYSGLKFLDLGGNLLVGELHDSISNMTRLEFLTLASNQLSGEIPRNLGIMKNLRWIYLGYNNFSGEIPKEIGELPFLNHLDLVYNNLTGEIPSSLGNLTNLEYLFLYFNKLTGPIPDRIFELKKLVSLDLSDNSLTGELPDSLNNCKSLQRIRIQKNRFSGEISPEFTALPLVYFLDLSSNKLSGRIDDRKWDMPQLQLLNLAKNEFFGELPMSFGSKKLENLDLSGNKFSGSIPQSTGGFSQLMELKLSENELSGRIPDQLSYCKKLVTLDLSHNHLTGEVPASLASIPVLGKLDLSVNELSGEIPSNLGEVASLVQINISYNHFKGSLPSNGAFLAINFTSVTGNKLCGGDKTTALPPCSSSKYHIRWYVLITSLLASLMVLAIFVSLSIFIKKRKDLQLKRVESDDGIWELYSLNSKITPRSITIDDILSYGSKSSRNNKRLFRKEVATTSTSFCTEWSELFKLDHPNIVKLLAICKSEKVCILVYEYIKGKDLSEALRGLSLDSRLKIASGIAKALKYLHCHCSSKIIIGDISTKKIMVDEKGEAHLRLNFQRINASADNKCLNSLAYVAPEAKDSKVVPTQKSDIYGFGLLLIELLTGKSPADTELGIHENIVEWARYCYSDCHLEMWVDSNMKTHALNEHQNQIVETMILALQCTAGDPEARPDAVHLVKSIESTVRWSSCVSFVRV
ncbi:inactive leucine-rich repeat receptor-like protein kinase [Dorcoceras hygrometricum]|uniref:Inactive leucine-rich repeat receptor-like protein kinase n=1 Tax=Dorcoceras hygrometricum TaxID=472368 RepID=A0A2Z7BRE4_9LAMI|nr:inactive leucine-rich repeat receptor-like protein kinase [Dorcoceras hygrometricum]